MKYAAIVLCLILSLFGCATTPVATMQKVAVRLEMDDGHCSGTVVGRHIVLTAEHCMMGQKTLRIDGRQVVVRRIILDHHDHALVVMDKEFSRWAFLGDAPTQGDPVYVLGNPGELSRIFRAGYDAGSYDAGGEHVEFLDFNGFYGDSGAGIFNSRGQLVAVVSTMYQEVSQGYIKFMGSFDLKFTDEDWGQANENLPVPVRAVRVGSDSAQR